MKEQIFKLIGEGKTEEALKLLVEADSSAILLQARFNNGKKQYNQNLIDYSEWGRIQASVNNGALEMAGSLRPGTGSGGTGATGSSSAGAATHKVFISYNHNDAFAMRAVKAHLEDNGIQVFVDIQDMGVGENIQAFIDKAFKETQIILSIVSENSLKSGWVNKELSATFLFARFGSKWLPVLLDQKCFDSGFYNDALDGFDEKKAAIQENIKKALEKGRGIEPFTDELTRINDLSNDFGKTIQNLKNHLSVDVSGKLFDSGMGAVVRAIKS